MIFKIIFLLLSGIALWCILVFSYKTKNIAKEDKAIKEKNSLLAIEYEKCLKQLHDINTSIRTARREKLDVLKEYRELSHTLAQMQDEIDNKRNNAEMSMQESFATYSDMLDTLYSQKEKEYDDLIVNLEQYYTQEQDRMAQDAANQIADLQVKIADEKEKLNNIRSTRQAIIAAQLKEEEIKKQKDFYCLSIAANDKKDIQVLEDVKHHLTNPRILSMLIWSTYFQKKMTALCNNILGTSTITGIYKITNQENNKCYIGQSVDISKRWKDHAKCGLGVDTPVGNKLYQDMQDFGIWNFSWELLEECPREQLNDKERYYIDLYQSKDYGYNTTKGNK